MLTAANVLLAVALWLWIGGGTWIWLLGSAPLWAMLLIAQLSGWRQYGQLRNWDELQESISKIRIISLITVLGGITMALLSMSELIHLKNLGVYMAANGSLLLILILKLQWEVGLITDKM